MEDNVGHFESHAQEMYDYQLDPAFIKDKLIDLAHQSRWKSLRGDDIKERPKETWEDWEKKLDKFFKEILGIEDEAHRVKTDKSKKGNTSKTIVWENLNNKDKIKILRNAKNLKDKCIFINDDFCQVPLDRRKELWKEVKRLKDEDKIAYPQYRSVAVKVACRVQVWKKIISSK